MKGGLTPNNNSLEYNLDLINDGIKCYKYIDVKSNDEEKEYTIWKISKIETYNDSKQKGGVINSAGFPPIPEEREVLKTEDDIIYKNTLLAIKLVNIAKKKFEQQINDHATEQVLIKANNEFELEKNKMSHFKAFNDAKSKVAMAKGEAKEAAKLRGFGSKAAQAARAKVTNANEDLISKKIVILEIISSSLFPSGEANAARRQEINNAVEETGARQPGEDMYAKHAAAAYFLSLYPNYARENIKIIKDAGPSATREAHSVLIDTQNKALKSLKVLLDVIQIKEKYETPTRDLIEYQNQINAQTIANAKEHLINIHNEYIIILNTQKDKYPNFYTTIIKQKKDLIAKLKVFSNEESEKKKQLENSAKDASKEYENANVELQKQTDRVKTQKDILTKVGIEASARTQAEKKLSVAQIKLKTLTIDRTQKQITLLNAINALKKTTDAIHNDEIDNANEKLVRAEGIEKKVKEYYDEADKRTKWKNIGDKKPTVSGLIWEKINASRSNVLGKKLQNPALVEALKELSRLSPPPSVIKFTKGQWHSFGITNLSNDNFVADGENHFRPIYRGKELENTALSTDLLTKQDFTPGQWKKYETVVTADDFIKVGNFYFMIDSQYNETELLKARANVVLAKVEIEITKATDYVELPSLYPGGTALRSIAAATLSATQAKREAANKEKTSVEKIVANIDEAVGIKSILNRLKVELNIVEVQYKNNINCAYTNAFVEALKREIGRNTPQETRRTDRQTDRERERERERLTETLKRWEEDNADDLKVLKHEKFANKLNVKHINAKYELESIDNSSIDLTSANERSNVNISANELHYETYIRLTAAEAAAKAEVSKDANSPDRNKTDWKKYEAYIEKVGLEAYLSSIKDSIKYHTYHTSSFKRSIKYDKGNESIDSLVKEAQLKKAIALSQRTDATWQEQNATSLEKLKQSIEKNDKKVIDDKKKIQTNREKKLEKLKEELLAGGPSLYANISIGGGEAHPEVSIWKHMKGEVQSPEAYAIVPARQVNMKTHLGETLRKLEEIKEKIKRKLHQQYDEKKKYVSESDSKTYKLELDKSKKLLSEVKHLHSIIESYKNELNEDNHKALVQLLDGQQVFFNKIIKTLETVDAFIGKLNNITSKSIEQKINAISNELKELKKDGVDGVSNYLNGRIYMMTNELIYATVFQAEHEIKRDEEKERVRVERKRLVVTWLRRWQRLYGTTQISKEGKKLLISQIIPFIVAENSKQMRGPTQISKEGRKVLMSQIIPFIVAKNSKQMQGTTQISKEGKKLLISQIIPFIVAKNSKQMQGTTQISKEGKKLLISQIIPFIVAKNSKQMQGTTQISKEGKKLLMSQIIPFIVAKNSKQMQGTTQISKEGKKLLMSQIIPFIVAKNSKQMQGTTQISKEGRKVLMSQIIPFIVAKNSKQMQGTAQISKEGRKVLMSQIIPFIVAKNSKQKQGTGQISKEGRKVLMSQIIPFIVAKNSKQKQGTGQISKEGRKVLMSQIIPFIVAKNSKQSKGETKLKAFKFSDVLNSINLNIDGKIKIIFNDNNILRSIEIDNIDKLSERLIDIHKPTNAKKHLFILTEIIIIKEKITDKVFIIVKNMVRNKVFMRGIQEYKLSNVFSENVKSHDNEYKKEPSLSIKGFNELFEFTNKRLE